MLIRKNRLLFFIILIIIFILISLLSVGIGSYFIPINSVIQTIYQKLSLGAASNKVFENIIFELRIPRIFLSLLVGAVLSLSGLVFQTVLKNPLAEPFTLGISSGASFGAALGIFLSEYLLNYRLPLFPFSFIGGLIAILVLFYFSLSSNISMFTLIFIGISITYFFNAFLTLILSLLGNRSYEVLMWIFGTFTNIPETKLFVIFTVLSIIGFVVIFLFRNILDSLYLSDEVVKSLGINISVTRGILFLTTSIMTIFAVSLCGIIGYVGLIVPHLAKILFGNKHKVLIPATVILGGIMMLISDDIARTLLSLINDYGKELPIGVVTSLFGTPFFLYFLLKQKKNQ